MSSNDKYSRLHKFLLQIGIDSFEDLEAAQKSLNTVFTRRKFAHAAGHLLAEGKNWNQVGEILELNPDAIKNIYYRYRGGRDVK